MAFNNNTPRLEFVASAAQTDFVFNFKIYATSDIVAYLTPTGQTADDTADILVLTTDYTIVIDGDDGGTLTLTSGATNGDKVTILRELPYTRTTDYAYGGDLLESTLDIDQDYQTYLAQQLESSKERFLNIPSSVQGVDASLPVPTALNFIRWNAAANALENINSLSADGYLWTAADVYTKTESDATFAKLTGANFTGLVGLNRGADVASATVLPIPVNGNSASVTGTTTVTSIATTGNVGTKLTYTFAGILTLTHHATDLILPGGANITTAVGDVFEFEEYAAGDYRCTGYALASGTAIAGSGKVLQTAHYNTGAVATGTALIPLDDTIPQITEGTEFMQLAFTPLSATSKLRIEIKMNATLNIVGTMGMALFRDSTTNAVGATIQSVAGSSQRQGLIMTVEVPSTAAVLTTFKVRAGGNAASTLTFNGGGAVRDYGGVLASNITITEIEA